MSAGRYPWPAEGWSIDALTKRIFSHYDQGGSQDTGRMHAAAGGIVSSVVHDPVLSDAEKVSLIKDVDRALDKALGRVFGAAS